MRRTIDQIQAEIDNFEQQFRTAKLPAPGTPNRKLIYREALAEDHRRACLQENIARRLALHAELSAAVRSAKAKAAAARKAADPMHQERQRIFRELRKLGFKREYTSGSSAYYRRRMLMVRISDHEVPMTAERQCALDNGGRTWANSRMSFIVGEDFEAWFENLRETLELEINN